MNSSFPSAPIVGVGAVVWRGDQVLLIRRGHPPRQGSWSLPGGRQQLGETVYQAVEREIAEETAVAIRILDIAAVVDLIHREDDRIAWHYTVIDVVAEWSSGTAVAGDDAEAVTWAGLDELAGFELTEAVLKVIEAARLKRQECGSPV